MTVQVIGNATLDLTYRVPRFPEPGETCLCTARHIGPGGKGLNQAVAAARAGSTVALHAPLGRDRAAERLCAALLREAGLELRAWFRDDLATDESSIWVSNDGENSIVSTADCARSVSAAEVREALGNAAPADVLVMQGNLTEATTVAALIAGRNAGLATVLNPAPLGFAAEPLCDKVDVFVVNRVEAAAFGVNGEGHGLGEFARRLGGTVIVTMGAQNILFADAAGGFGEHPVAPVTPVDTTGAGDAFVGSLAAAIEQGTALPEAIARAAKVACQTVMTLGALTGGEVSAA